MKLADTLAPGVTSWRDLHAALVSHNEPGNPTAGYLFEEFARYFFLAAPEYRDEFKNIWAETEIPTRVRKKLTLATRDHGVDLLLEDHEGRFHAVQCKFKTDQSKTLGWTKDRLSSWLAESDEAQGLVMFTNASGIDKQSTLKAAKKDFTLVTVGDLVSVSPETVESILRLAKGKAPKKTKRLKPYPHQRRAINDVVNGFRTHDRGQLILPCGAGKTLTSLWVKERLGAKRTLVLVPSLALLRQMRREWAAQQKGRLPYLCVCSEKDIDKDKRDAIVTHTFEVPGHVTTRPHEIAAFARKHRELVVYSTYQSLQAVVDAGVEFDLAICDEAHKTATARHNAFALVHEDGLKAEKRLYMTATPRVLSAIAKGRLGEDAFEVIADMSDEETFGPEFHRMSFADAIEQGILVDYKIVVVGVSDREAYEHIEKRTYLEDASADQVATSLAVAKVMKKHGLAHGLTFHSNVKRAKSFTALHSKRTRKTEVAHVNGSMSTNDRLVLLDEFEEAPRAVMTNARCLTEGVDVPAIDCIAFVDPKHSKVDIVQAAGRALRLPRGGHEKPYGVILIPIFYEVGEDPEDIAASGIFKNVFEVVRAMADQDERLQAEIMNIKFGEGEKPVVNPRVQVDIGDDKRLILTGFEKQLKAALVERVVKHSFESWEVRLEELKRFKAEHGHCNVPPRDSKLGFWVSTQRSFQGRGELSAARKAKLDSIGFTWNVRDDLREQRYRDLEGFKAEHGHTRVTMSRNKSLAHFVHNLRSRKTRGTLPQEEIARLDALGFIWDVFAEGWEARFSELEEYVAKHGHCNVAQSDGELGVWVSQQRMKYKENKLPEAQRQRLEALGFLWDPRGLLSLQGAAKGSHKLDHKKALTIYKDPRSTREIAAEHGVSVGTVQAIKRGKTWRHVTGHSYVPPKPRLTFEERVSELRAFEEEHGHCRVTEQYDPSLAVWVQKMRKDQRRGKLSKKRFTVLDALGFVWDIKADVIDGYTVPEFAALFGVSADIPQSWIRRGMMKAEHYPHPVGYRIPREELERAKKRLGVTHLAGEWEDKYMTVKDLMERDGVSKPTVHLRIRTGKLTPIGKAYAGAARAAWLFEKDSKVELGERYKGAANPNANLTEEQVLAIFHDARSQKMISRETGVPIHTVRKIQTRETWQELTAGMLNGREQKALDIYHAEGSHKQIAEQFGVSRSLVSQIKEGRIWTEVTGHKTGAAK